ncbi:MAG: TolC family protein [Pseudohongiellaceae bacterium]|nr:TolC family protein [Pseudohongiellaceae bacterium]
MKPLKSLAIAVSLLSLSACQLLETPAPALPENLIPQTWTQAQGNDSSNWPASDWWNEFEAAELSELIATISQQNFDLSNSRRNLESAQISLKEAGFELLPRATVSIGTAASYIETRSDDSRSSDSPNTPFELNGNLSYSNILTKPAVYSQAIADYDTRVAQDAALKLNTLATSASTYFQLLLTRDKIEAAQQNVENARAISEIANARVEAGVAVPIEALQQQIALQREQASLSALQQNDLSARAALALLSGTNVQGFNIEGQTLETITVPSVSPGLSSELLLRRPDLVQAEAQLRSAAANVDIARLSYFPTISLTGNASASSTSLSELLSSPDTFLNINASLLQTLLDTGQRSRALDQRKLALGNALDSYQKATLAAFNEIEVLLSSLRLQQEQLAVAQRNLEAAEESFRIAQVRYEEGVSDFQTVLTSQNTLFASRNSYLDNKLAQLNIIVNLYQALGGGWVAETP